MTCSDSYSSDSSSEGCCGKKNKCEKKYSKKCCKVTDKFAKHVLCLWKKYFCDALILPKIGYPSCAKGVATLMHGLHLKHKMKLNGLESNSALTNKALYSFECSNGQYINLYEVMLPDIPGKCGKKSTTEVFTKALCK